ncbi:MAG TPA: hypothetical protein VI756_22680, partial [Blastocatellia bacterium]
MAASVTTIAKTSEESGSFLDRLEWYYQVLILVGLVVLLIIAAHYMLFDDTRNETKKIIEQVQQLKASNSQGNM